MKTSTKYAWLDGKMIPLDAAKIPLLTHSLHYGSAVFEGIRCYKTPNGSAVFRLSDHVNRLFHSATVMGMRPTFTKTQIAKAIKNVVKKNKLEECYIRPIFFYGEKMGLLPIGAPLHSAIAVWPWGKYLSKETVTVKISTLKRLHPQTSLMTAKISGHYFNSILASLEAKKAGFDEALFLDSEDFIAEGPGENIFFAKGKTLVTPALGAILPGITRASVIKIARDLGYRVAEKKIKPSDLKKFDEAFFVGTAAEVNAIGKINKVVFNGSAEGINTKLIKEVYRLAVHGEIKKYRSWLAYI
jgi:branched-chain amino acid aminotransferase